MLGNSSEISFVRQSISIPISLPDYSGFVYKVRSMESEVMDSNIY